MWWALLPASAQGVFSQTALRSIGASSLFPAPSPARRSSVSRSPSPPPSRLDPEALLRQRNQLCTLSSVMFAAIFVWRVWFAPVEGGGSDFGGGGSSSRAFSEHGLSPYPGAGAPPPALPPMPAALPAWPPLRADAAAPLAWGGLLVPVTLGSGGGGEGAWAAPPSALPLRAARGVALLFHGCSHTGAVWATGGAPEREVVAALLAQRLLPVALTSADARSGGSGGGHGCWDLGSAGAAAAPAAALDGSDNAGVRAAIAALAAHWAAERGSSGSGSSASSASAQTDFYSRLVAVGVSSGGAFVSQLALHVPLRALGVYIMPLLPGALQALAGSGGGALTREWVAGVSAAAAAAAGASAAGPGSAAIPAPLRYPATLAFVHMPLDASTASRVAGQCRELQAAKGYSAGAVHNWLVPPRPLWGSNVSAYLGGVGGARSLLTRSAGAVLWGALGSAGLLVESPAADVAAAVGAAGAEGWWCASPPACAGAGSEGARGQWLGAVARSEEVGEVLEGFLRDERLAWRQALAAGGGGGGGASGAGPAAWDLPCVWDWGAGGVFGESGGPCEGSGAGGGALGLRAEALRMLRRGLGEMLNEAEGGHEMTSAFAGDVAGALARAVEEGGSAA